VDVLGHRRIDTSIYDMIWIYLTAIWFTPGGSIVHIYARTIRRTTHLTTLVGRLSGIRNQSG
jgi:tRNA(Phe) wybutosine-synthesizing methylase Tyw3